MVNTNAQTPPLALLPMSAAGARQLAGTIRRLWWACTIMLVIYLFIPNPGSPYRPSAGGWVVDLVIRTAQSLLPLFALFSILQLVRQARRAWTTKQRPTGAALVNVFLMALCLLMIYTLVTTVFVFGLKLTPLFGPVGNDLVRDGMLTVIYGGLTLGMRGMAALFLGFFGRYAPAEYVQRQRWLFRVWMGVLGIFSLMALSRLVLVLAWKVNLLEDAAWAVWVYHLCEKSPALLLVVPITWSFMTLMPLRHGLSQFAASNFCVKCDYDLRGNLGGGCPECGWGRTASPSKTNPPPPSLTRQKD